MKTCSVSESGSYVHCGDAELELVALSLVFVVIFGKESAIDKKKVRRISQILNCIFDSLCSIQILEEQLAFTLET